MYQKENSLYIKYYVLPINELIRVNLQKKLDINLIKERKFMKSLHKLLNMQWIRVNKTLTTDKNEKVIMRETTKTYTSVFNKYKQAELNKVNDYYLNNSLLPNDLLELPTNEEVER